MNRNIDRNIDRNTTTAIKSRISLHPPHLSHEFTLTTDTSLWNRIRPQLTVNHHAKIIHLFYGLSFLKLYEKYKVHASICRCDEGTFKLWAFRFVQAIEHLQYSLIVFHDRFLGMNPNCQCTLSIDGTDFSKQEQRPNIDPQEKSVKLKHAAWKYEIGFGIFTGLIHWVNGPYKAGKPDRTVFREDLELLLEDWEFVETDLGYEGAVKAKDKEIYLTRADGHKKAVVRSRHETINSRFSNFGVTRKTFWHSKEEHGMCVRAIAVVIQLGLIHKPIWEVDYDINYNDTDGMFQYE